MRGTFGRGSLSIWAIGLGLLLALLVAVGINQGRHTTTEQPAGGGRPVLISARKALADLARLPIKGRAPKTGYSRTQFGEAWTDDVSVADGHNGCDTRNDILKRDLTDASFRRGSDCVVTSGELHDAYTGRAIDFVRGPDTSEAVQIDHIVALSDAWQTGAQQLSVEQRTDLANDPLNLQAVDGPTNQAKGDSDAASWLPPNRSYHCTYVSRQVEVKVKYHLWVTRAEHDAIEHVMQACV